MSTKWMNWRLSLVIIAITVGILTLISQSTGTPEVRNADSPSNFVLVDPRPSAEDWPWWRGVDGRNVALSKQFPLQWSESNHPGWQVGLSGLGSATPSIWGDRLFLPVFEPDSQRLYLKCVTRRSGVVAWKTMIHDKDPKNVRDSNLLHLATPVCDGQSVFTVAHYRDQLWVTAVDFSGRVLWQNPAGRYLSETGSVSSPTLYKSLVIVTADQARDSYIAAIHRQTGEVIWRTRRPKGESLGTPVVGTIAGRAQVVVGGPGAVISYDPATGEPLWTCRISASHVLSSVTFDSERVFATTAQPNAEVICIAADGTGDVTTSHVVWRDARLAGEVPSPVCHGGLLYVLAEDGRLSCVQAATGKLEWIRQLSGTFSASPVIAGDFVFCASESGETYFVRTGTANPVIIKNTLAEGIVATPIFAGDSIFIRTIHQLHRISGQNVEPVVERGSDVRRRF
ncbi:PQQ-binding-like beta-propeller repeat protein [Schlesneria sp. DSM 10557]|uniref:outer membrane protein assembly factor BamB family protein n=1 Tax=Schlesneria sp. DSM 10557 TaxID=3044399 RepID=UPI00359FDA73